MIPAPLRIRFRADLLEPIAHFLLKGDRAEPCHITFSGAEDLGTASALRDDLPRRKSSRVTASSNDCYVSRDATLSFNRRVLSAITTALLTRPDHVEESDDLADRVGERLRADRRDVVGEQRRAQPRRAPAQGLDHGGSQRPVQSLEDP